MSGKNRKIVEFERLNLLGKAVFITGSTFRLLGNFFESTVETISGIVSESEKAFHQGLDSRVVDATIVRESGPTEEDVAPIVPGDDQGHTEAPPVSAGNR